MTERISLSDYLRRAQIEPHVVAYAAQLEQVSLSGQVLAKEIRNFVSTGGQGDAAERVEHALRRLDTHWNALGQVRPAQSDPGPQLASD